MLMNDNEYLSVLETIKTQIDTTQARAVLGLNKEKILLYWKIGELLSQRISWGNKFIDNLSTDIKLEYPHVKGYSPRNLRYMRKFADSVCKIKLVP